MFKVSYIYDLVDNISPQLKKIQQNLETTRSKTLAFTQSTANSFKNLSNSLQNTSTSLKNIGTALAPASIATGLIGAKAFKSAAEMEMLRIRMDVLTGSVEKGAIAFNEVTKYAALTPFEINDVSKSLNMLMSTGGMKFEEAMRSVKVLGDIAAISGGEMSGMALAFSQTAATTRLLGMDFNQFVNNSVPLMKILTDYTGKSSAEIMAMKEAGQLSFDIVAKAMEKATQKGGLFENGALKMSQTLGGLASTLRDSVNMAFAELGAEMAKSINLAELIKNIGIYIDKLKETFKNLSPETKKFISYAILIVAALSPLVLTFASIIGVLAITAGGFAVLASSIAFLITPIGLITASITGAITALYLFRDSFITVGNYLIDELAPIFNYIADKIKLIIDLISQFRSNAAIVLDFIGLEKLSSMIAPNLDQQTQINKPQQFTAGGQLDVNIKGLPKGSSAGFTPRSNNFLPVGINSVFAGS